MSLKRHLLVLVLEESSNGLLDLVVYWALEDKVVLRHDVL
jgi:hypothetical protein